MWRPYWFLIHGCRFLNKKTCIQWDIYRIINAMCVWQIIPGLPVSHEVQVMPPMSVEKYSDQNTCDANPRQFLARPSQTLLQHLENVSDTAAGFAAIFGAKPEGKILGFLHDIGKYSNEFQQRLSNPKIKTDHATAGAKELAKLGPFGGALAYAAIGHHSGLPDTGSAAGGFTQRIAKDIPGYDNCEWRREFAVAPRKFRDMFSLQFFIRMLFSCLVDADRLDAGQKETADLPLAGLYEKIPVFPNDSALGRRRDEVRDACAAAAEGPRGLYTLTVPTGGGKTWSSLAFALKHAAARGLRRVIYAIPYTSIIEQTADQFRKALGAENILEHHSNYAFEDSDDDERDLHAENWDAPIVITTNVQFLESLFSHRPGRCRKIHNIAGSVVILDEAQMLPIPFLDPCRRALQELADNYNCTIVLMSATQPPHFENAVEIIKNRAELEKFFKRTETIKLGPQNDDELARDLLQEPQVLAIVNTKGHAADLAGRIGAYCLTTNLCPAHRCAVLDEIKSKLRAGAPVRVVSTQLIEAGVDIDFPVVYRAACGLDSLAQSAGRCNREGKLPALGRVYHFESPHEKLRGYLQRTAAIGAAAENLDDYFARLAAIEEKDAKKIMEEFKHSLNFETVGNLFRLIEDSGRPVVIPFDDNARKLLNDLRFTEHKKKILRGLRRYSVNVRHGVRLPTEMVADLVEVLCDMDCYDEKLGLKPNTGAEAIFA
jgi:CRISPR-associated endonuclease/helicase Cas3